MKNPILTLPLWLLALLVVVACVPGAAAPVTVPTLDPNGISTAIAQTARVAFTRTAAALPSPTPTATFTRTPAGTDTPEPTATATIIFIFSSPTAPIPATSTANGTSNQAYSCQIMNVSPPNGSSFDPRREFVVTWTLRNNGTRNWNKDLVSFAFLDGDKLHKVETYALEETIRRGETVTLKVDMVAPKKATTYKTTWTMVANGAGFCPLSYSIVVR